MKKPLLAFAAGVLVIVLLAATIQQGGFPVTGIVGGNGVALITNGTAITLNIATTNYTVQSAGTIYTLTASYALLDFGTTDPAITITTAGTYLIWANANFTARGATYAATNTYSIKLRKTSGTPADVTGAARTLTIPIITTVSEDFGLIDTPPVV